MLAILLIKKIIELFIFLFVGFIVVKLKLLKSDSSIVLSKLCMYVIFPCTLICIFQQQISAALVKDLLYATVIAFIMNFGIIGLGAIFGRIFHLTVVEESSVMYPNSGNLIIPLISYMFGDEWLVFTAPYMAIQGVLMFTHAKGMYAKGRPSFKSIIGNTTILFTIIGLVLMITRIQLPSEVGNVLSEMKNMLGPLSMIVSGMLIAETSAKKVFQNKRVWIVIALRLIVIPLILIVGLSLCLPDALAQREYQINLIILLACMAPVASTMVQFAQVYHADEHYASAINILTTLFCIGTMPLLVIIYQRLFAA